MADITNLGDVASGAPHGVQTALIDLSRGAERRYSFLGLDNMACGIARALAKRGYGRGEAIGIIGPNSAEYLACYLGIMKAGLVAVPLNWKLPNDQLTFLVKDSGMLLAFVDSAVRDRLPASLETVLLDTENEASSLATFAVHGNYRSEEIGDNDPALILYTSGSTGQPKGVVLTHQSQLSAVDGLGAMGRLMSGKATIVAAPLFHMNALTFCHLMLFYRGQIVLMSRFDARAYLSAIEAYRVAIVSGVPTMISLVARETGLLQKADFSSVLLVAVGSAPVTEGLLREINAIFPNASVTNGYGTTEIGPAVFGAHPDGLPRPPMSIGHPQAGYEVRLVGTADDEGVLEVRGPGLMTGYKDRPELTAERLRDGFYSTGDIMRRDADGFFYFVGRADDMFVCSGENIYPREVEKILEEHADIIEVCVVPRDDEIRGKVPVAFVVCRDGASVTEEEVKEFALSKGPAYLHPRRVFFLDALPLAGTNKIDRKVLQEMAVRS